MALLALYLLLRRGELRLRAARFKGSEHSSKVSFVAEAPYLKAYSRIQESNLSCWLDQHT